MVNQLDYIVSYIDVFVYQPNDKKKVGKAIFVAVVIELIVLAGIPSQLLII